MADKKKKPTMLRLNVMLLKDTADFGDPKSFIQSYKKSQEFTFDKGDVEALLYLKKGALDYPPWVTMFPKKIANVDLTKRISRNQSYGLTLYIKVDGRIFAINWGVSGRFNTQQDYIDKKFGIYVANKILIEHNDNVKIKSAQSRVNQSNPINKERQYGESIPTEELLLSMEDNEAFKELNISIENSNDFQKMIGKYSSLNVQFLFKDGEVPSFPHLPKKLKSLLKIYKEVKSEDIKKLFKGLYPTAPTVTDELNVALASELRKEAHSFFLFEPEIDFDFSTVSSFKITADGDRTSSNEELLLSDYITLRPSPTLDNLRADSLSVIDEDDKEVKQWSLFDCLYGEILHKRNNYILSHGEWFEVVPDKYKRINDKIDAILDASLTVSNAVKTLAQDNIQVKVDDPNVKKVDKERIFNTAWCSELNGELFDLGAKQISLYEDKFEVCDIFLPPGRKFIHVKNNTGAGALSHLFNQGYVSAVAFGKFTADYVGKVNEKIVDPARHLVAPHNGACIHYVILNNKHENRLTFFSKMALEDRVTTLEGMGFEVKLTWIKNAYQ